MHEQDHGNAAPIGQCTSTRPATAGPSTDSAAARAAQLQAMAARNDMDGAIARFSIAVADPYIDWLMGEKARGLELADAMTAATSGITGMIATLARLTPAPELAQAMALKHIKTLLAAINDDEAVKRPSIIMPGT